MARLKHVTSGAIVEVTEEKATRMGSEWEPADKKSTDKPAAKTQSKK